MTYMAFKVLCFLMLYKDFLIIKIPVAIPAPGLQLLLFLPAHRGGATEREKGEKQGPAAGFPAASRRKTKWPPGSLLPPPPSPGRPSMHRGSRDEAVT